MSSTYSPNLRIDLIDTGTQSGTWGATTNVNLGSLIEAAISGYETVTVTGTQALTASNGTPDQSRNMTIEFVGTLVSSANVFIPPAEKFYVFKNSANQAVTILVATTLNGTTQIPGSTTVTIPAGKTMMVICNNTNVYEALDNINGNLDVGGDVYVGGTASIAGAAASDSLTLTGTPLQVSSGGTGVVNITAGTIPRGNGTLPLSAASADDIVANIGTTPVQRATNVAGGAANRIVYNTAANATGFLPAPTAVSQYLRFNGATLEWGTLPSGGVLAVTADSPLASSGGSSPNITLGTVPTSKGGTGLTTVGTNGQVLTSNGTSLTWSTPASGGVPSFSAGTTGLTPSTATTTAITLGGTLNVSNGGTGVTTLTGIVKGNGTGAFTAAVSGTDFKTVNSTSILGSGNIGIGVTSVAAGAGMNFTTITGTGTVTMGTPGTISTSSSNSATTGTHTHQLNTSGLVLSSQFTGASNQSLGSTGYQRLPGGLLIQWGFISTMGGGGLTTITFPTAFTTVYSVNAMAVQIGSTAGVGSDTVVSALPTTTSVVISVPTDRDGLYWMAIGV